MYDKGLSPCAGLLKQFVLDNIIEQNGAWYSCEGVKFQRKDFDERFLTDEKFSSLRKEVGLDTQPLVNKELKAE